MANGEIAEDRFNPDSVPAGTTIGYYTITRRVDSGGFGTLYLVERDGKRYALKLSHTRFGDLSEEERAHTSGRTDQEISALKQLRHPNIVKVHAAELWPELETGFPYLVMDYVDGPPFCEWFRRESPTLREVCAIFEKLSRAVAYMHEVGVYHRDLKSENVMVRAADAEPVIVDFGIARNRQRFGLTRHIEVVGTPGSFAPEYLAHIESHAFLEGVPFEWTNAQDLHSLGCMFYEVLASRPPFLAESELELRELIKRVTPDAPSHVNRGVPEVFDPVVLKLLAKDPEERYRTGAELADEIEHLREAHHDDADWSKPLHLALRSKRSGDPSVEGPDRISEEELPKSAARRAFLFPAPSPAGTSQIAPAMELGFRPPTAERTEFVEVDPQGEKEDRAQAGSSIRRVQERFQNMAEPAKPHRVIKLLLLAGALLLALFAMLRIHGSGANHPKEGGGPTSLLQKAERSREVESGFASVKSEWGVPSSERPADASNGNARTVAAASAPGEAAPSTASPEGGPTPDGGEPRAAPEAEKAHRTRDAHRRIQAKPKADAQETPVGMEPSWVKRSSSPAAARVAAAVESGPLGVPLGSHLPVKLVTTLDSRTVGNGPVEARLNRPFILRGEVKLPAGTMLYGSGSAAQARFMIRFSRMRLPDDRTVEFSGVALDHGDGRAGLAASRGTSSSQPSPSAPGLGEQLAKGAASTALNYVPGLGLTADLARSSGQMALNQKDSLPGSGSTGAALLDPGAVFDVFVEKAF